MSSDPFDLLRTATAEPAATLSRSPEVANTWTREKLQEAFTQATLMIATWTAFGFALAQYLLSR